MDNDDSVTRCTPYRMRRLTDSEMADLAEVARNGKAGPPKAHGPGREPCRAGPAVPGRSGAQTVLAELPARMLRQTPAVWVDRQQDQP